MSAEMFKNIPQYNNHDSIVSEGRKRGLYLGMEHFLLAEGRVVATPGAHMRMYVGVSAAVFPGATQRLDYMNGLYNELASHRVGETRRHDLASRSSRVRLLGGTAIDYVINANALSDIHGGTPEDLMRQINDCLTEARDPDTPRTARILPYEQMYRLRDEGFYLMGFPDGTREAFVNDPITHHTIPAEWLDVSLEELEERWLAVKNASMEQPDSFGYMEESLTQLR